MYQGTKKIMGQNYKTFCKEMLGLAEDDSLPAAFQLDSVYDLTCQDIGDLCNEFEKDTGLDLTAHIFVCHDCGRTHILFEVNYIDEEEDEDTSYLQ